MPKDNLLKEATLIKKADKVIKANKTAQKQYNFGFNIFTALNIERDEVFTHSNMIYALLNPRGNHGMGDTYLKLFLKEIGVSKTFLNYSWSLEREWVFENGRIDFFLKCKKMCIAIEMIIDAGDQDKQLIRYEEYSKCVNSNYLIYYYNFRWKVSFRTKCRGDR
ncbi:PD-(D/E)XK nuclease family protein [Clostridium sp. C2-6-12]|uniref:PDDEXK-like family protein n=1 Tax=Clostridium sp. C2-6-12 TaxID=2698832 RepID=UPI00136E2C7A|nr:PD-(D/E)XK nuclease family protein [Clostridium sp. C2-6-12]